MGSRGWRGLVKRSCRGTRDACFAPLGCALISMRLPGKIRLARRLMSSPSRSGCQPARERLSPPCAPLTPAGKLVFAQAAPPFLSAEETCRSAEAGLMFYGGTGCPALLLNLTEEEGVPPPVWRTPPRTTSRSPFSQSPRGPSHLCPSGRCPGTQFRLATGGSRDFVSALDLPQKIRKSFDCLFKMRRNQLPLRRDYSENKI